MVDCQQSLKGSTACLEGKPLLDSQVQNRRMARRLGRIPHRFVSQKSNKAQPRIDSTRLEISLSCSGRNDVLSVAFSCLCRYLLLLRHSCTSAVLANEQEVITREPSSTLGYESMFESNSRVW